MTLSDAHRLAWAAISIHGAPLPPRDSDPLHVSQWFMIERVARALVLSYEAGRRDTWWRRLWRKR